MIASQKHIQGEDQKRDTKKGKKVTDILYFAQWNILVHKHVTNNPGNEDPIGTKNSKENLEVEIAGQEWQPVPFIQHWGKKDCKKDTSERYVYDNYVNKVHQQKEQNVYQKYTKNFFLSNNYFFIQSVKQLK